MNEQWAIVTVSILIGFAIGWQIGYWRCRKRYGNLMKELSRTIGPLGTTRKDGEG